MRKTDKQVRRAEQPLVLDLSAVATADDLHSILASSLGFPDWYGRNWDAFRDCVTDPELSSIPPQLHVHGFAELSSSLPREARLLRECLEELPLERPEITVEIS